MITSGLHHQVIKAIIAIIATKLCVRTYIRISYIVRSISGLSLSTVVVNGFVFCMVGLWRCSRYAAANSELYFGT